MMRRPVVTLVAVLAAAAIAIVAIALTRPTEEGDGRRPAAATGDALLLLVVRTDAGPFAAVVGSTGGPVGALAVPTEITVTVPGQGDLRLDDALALPPDDAAITVANALGVAIRHYAVIGRVRLAAIVDRVGGLDLAGTSMSGDEVVSTLEGAKRGRTLAFQIMLEQLFAGGVDWSADDLAVSDDAGRAVSILDDARGTSVVGLPIIEPAKNIYRAEPDAVRSSIVKAFGGPDRPLVGAIVLNGSGTPGVGRAVAERIVPAGFSVVVSENASSFDHEETLVVVGSAGDVPLGQRVRDLLGTGTVSVSVSSGLAPVTIVVGKDFGTG
jgi:hypothetical protein